MFRNFNVFTHFRPHRVRTVSEAADIEAAGRTYLETYKALTAMSALNGKLAFVMVPKWHQFAHVLWDGVRGRRWNPRFHHTFNDEDAMRVLKTWTKGANARRRESGISRLYRLRMKSLEWRLPEVALKR